MSHHEIRLFADAANQLGESPLWCPEERRLWWIDVAQAQLLAADAADGRVRSWTLPKPPGAIARIDAQHLLLALRSGLAVVKTPGGELQWANPPGMALGDERFNDGKADRAGRFWVGTMDRRLQQPLGAVYSVERGAMREQDRGFVLSNGIGWSPDNKTMYFSDTFGRSIHAYDYDIERGTVARRRLFAQVDSGPGGPDGLTVDADGGVWSVMFERSSIHRYRPDGRLDLVLKLPVSRPTSCTFGGSGLRTLYITSARLGLQGEALAREPWAGGVLAVELPHQGLAEPAYLTGVEARA